MYNAMVEEAIVTRPVFGKKPVEMELRDEHTTAFRDLLEAPSDNPAAAMTTAACLRDFVEYDPDAIAGALVNMDRETALAVAQLIIHLSEGVMFDGEWEWEE